MNPITRKRLCRFRSMKRAYWSFWLLVILYALSLCGEVLCNSVPLFVYYREKCYFPVFEFYTDDEFTGSGKLTRPDYKAIAQTSSFNGSSSNFMVFPPVPFGPYEVLDPASVEIPDQVTLELVPEPRVASLDITQDLGIARSVAAGEFFGFPDRELRGRQFADLFVVPERLIRAVQERFRDVAAEKIEVICELNDETRVSVSMAPRKAGTGKPRTVRVMLREKIARSVDAKKLVFDRELNVISGAVEFLDSLPESTSSLLKKNVVARFARPVEDLSIKQGNTSFRGAFFKEEVRFPFRPVKGHWLGIDDAGRDVFARVYYGFRTSMTFGLILVVCSMCLGTLVGSVQGYLGGKVDILAQRVVEIWSALPFLYVMILMGSIYGRSFVLLIFCYGLFNWIGISYYMRAEMLRLRGQPFVEAARCLGLPARRILLKHILPNALVPLVTFFPFSLVGAIGSLAALDFLGFGLPPPTPSWGQLLQQGQVYRWAWWLILYPALALFTVMLLGVFMGEGVRNAFDPKPYSRMN